MANRWDALDVLRGLTIILMLMNLTPGSWEFNYPFLVHAKWEGWTLIDMVAPAFLFCIGAAMPLSLERRSVKGDSRVALLRHVLSRGALLIAIGLFLNLYPNFDFATSGSRRPATHRLVLHAHRRVHARRRASRHASAVSFQTTGGGRGRRAGQLLAAALLRAGAGIRSAALRSVGSGRP
jgi:hypothetical protein